jgi:hypothetical protein
MFDAELILAFIDGIGGDTSVDLTCWPIERQRQILERFFEKLDSREFRQ